MNHHTKAVALAAALCAGLSANAHAQLTPDREYYGVNRAIPMTAEMPAGVAGEVEIALLSPDGTEISRAAAAEGSVDLAGLFPVLWTEASSTATPVKYAQLIVDDKPIGSSVVLVPMVTPAMASLQGRQAVFPERPPQMITFGGIRAWTDRHVVFTTTEGEIEFRLRPDQAPNTVANFIDLVEGGYYTDILFHRIIGARDGRDPFMAQVGDPTGTGSGGPGRFVDLEPSALEHNFGVLSMARTGDPDTNGGQVFVCFSREGTYFLDTQYTAFAQAVSGGETILKLEAVETNASDRPLNPPVLQSARTVAAPPLAQEKPALERPEDDGR